MTTLVDTTTHPASAGPAPPVTIKVTRFVVVTLIASPGNLLLYAILLAHTTWPAFGANLIAAVVVAGPTYLLNRRWVWARRDPHRLRAEIVPYWAATVANVTLSSMAAAALEKAGAGDVVLVAATFAVYTVLWFARFIFLDALFQGRSMKGSSSVSA